jgi:hypothetical protein
MHIAEYFLKIKPNINNMKKKRIFTHVYLKYTFIVIYTFTMYPGIKERLNVYLNLYMHTVQLNFTFSIYSLSWDGSHYILYICENIYSFFRIYTENLC